MSDFDSFDFFRVSELVVDPYPYFDYLRAQCPVQREPHHGVVMVTGYDEALKVYTDTATFSSCNSVTGPFPGFPVPLEGDDVSDLIEQHRDELHDEHKRAGAARFADAFSGCGSGCGQESVPEQRAH